MRKNSVLVALLAAGSVFVSALAQESRAPATRSSAEVQIILESPPASTWDVVTFEEIEPAAAEDYVAMVRREMGLYPPKFLEKSGLRAIVVVKDLKVSGQPRAVAPDPYKQVVYCDPTIGAHHPVYQRHALHHDFFHFLMGRWEGDMYFKDPQWIAICGPDVKWGAGGVNAQTGDQYAMTHPAPGFVNRYSQSAVEEDMGEIFAILMVPEELERVETWAEEDGVLRAKLDYIPRLLARHVGEGSVPPTTRSAESATPARSRR